jgi:tetratricopeptide (TPR) repeat protein/predicted Ser/Thr protein kinase
MGEPEALRSKEIPGPLDLSGTMVGRFAIRARVGVGGMGEVYRADDTKLKRSVALKRIAPRLRTDPNFRQRFLKEAERASALSDQRIAGVYDVLEEKDETFLVMEYVEGSTLRGRLGKPFSLEQFLPIALQCAEALVAAHGKGVVHLDIKPENIMLTPKGQVKILDFGVAKRLPRSTDQTDSGSVGGGRDAMGGTPAYMAPEVLLEEHSDQRADIFSLGVVFYEMLAGKHPFRAESFVATCDNVLREEPAPLSQLNPHVPPRLEDIVAKMLAKNPNARPADVAKVLGELQALEREETSPVISHRRLLPQRPRAWVAGLVGLVVVILLGLALVPAVRRQVGHWMGVAAVPETKNLAVLPFTVTGGPATSVAFANGLTETLNARLTRLSERHSLLVIPAGEVRAEKVRTLDEARREFGVNLVIEGSLQQAGDMVRVTYALVDAQTRRQLRADTVTAAMADPFAVEDRVTASVLDNLEVELEPAERQTLAAHGTSQPAAYEFYLQGRGYLQEYSKSENIQRAIDVFNRALATDPHYALAFAGLGEAFWLRYEGTHDAQWVEKALAACEQASSFDTSLGSAHTCLGVVYNGTGRYEQAVGEFRQAVELEPTSDAAYRGLAHAYERLGKPQEAEETYRRAIALRPQYWAGYSWLGVFYYMQARYAEAAEMFEQVVKLAPDSFRGYSNLGGTYNAEGRYAEAIRACQRSAAIRPTADAYGNLGTAHFGLKQFAEAAQAYEKAIGVDPQEFLWWGNLGDARYWAPGQRVQATSAYRQAILLAQEKLRINPREARTLGYLAYYYAMIGDRKSAQSCLERGLAVAPNDAELRFNAALAHNQLGDRDQALEWLEKALAAGISPAMVRDNPFLDNLRTDPRYLRLIQRAQR